MLIYTHIFLVAVAAGIAVYLSVFPSEFEVASLDARWQDHWLKHSAHRTAASGVQPLVLSSVKRYVIMHANEFHQDAGVDHAIGLSLAKIPQGPSRQSFCWNLLELARRTSSSDWASNY